MFNPFRWLSREYPGETFGPERGFIGMQALERRELLSVTLEDGVLTIIGTPGNDVILVEAGPAPGEVVVTGDPHGGDGKWSGVRSIHIDVGDGDDTVTIGDGVVDEDGNFIGATIYAGAGSDMVYGGQGADRIYGGSGHDVLSGGGGEDIIDGGADFDMVSYEYAPNGVTVLLNKGTAHVANDDRDQLRNIEGVIGSDYDDYLVGDNRKNILFGGAGNDAPGGRRRKR